MSRFLYSPAQERFAELPDDAPAQVFGFDPDEAIEVDRLPREHAGVSERWEAGAWAFDVAALDAALHARIDAEAGAMRALHITTAPGQELIYLTKETQARGWAEGADPADFPLLAAEAAAIGETIAELAAAVIARADECAAVNAAIEGLRIGAKRAVSAAEGWDAKIAAAAVEWESVLESAE